MRPKSGARRIAVFCALLAMGMPAGAEPAASPPAVVHAEGVAPHVGVDAVYRRFAAAYDALDAAAVADLYTAEALYLVPGNEVMRGRDAILTSFAGFFDAVRSEGGRLAIRFEILDRVVAPGLVSDARPSAAAIAPPSSPPSSPTPSSSPPTASGVWIGSFQSLWRRQPNGSWRVLFDGAPSCRPPGEAADGDQ